MKRLGIVLATSACLAVSMIAGFASRGAAEESAELTKMRNDTIEHFKRIGLNTTAGDATFLRILIVSGGVKRGVEVGAATGYGAINMGWGFEQTGGHLTTIDIDPQMVEATRENVKKMKLEESVTAIEGDALEVLPKLEGEYDFLFIDAHKPDYLKYFKAIEPKLKVGSIIVADNVIKSESKMLDYLEYVRTSPNYLSVRITASDEKGDGMEVTYKLR